MRGKKKNFFKFCQFEKPFTYFFHIIFIIIWLIIQCFECKNHVIKIGLKITMYRLRGIRGVQILLL